ncbi:MAG: hypothetical protein AAGF83_14715 [Cyanobacteria bacterium P01_G01_bin.67]
MISIDTKAHPAKIFTSKQAITPAQKKLIARWTTVDSKLVCRWVKA